MIYHEIKESDRLNKDLYFEILDEAVGRLNCEKVILGCTELSLMQEFASNNPYPVIDAQSLIADRTIELALENRKKLPESV